MPVAPPPYVLDTPAFRFSRLAAHVGRAPVGGRREVALATYLVARMVHDMSAERGVAPPLRRERATAAKGWLSSVALPTPTRTALVELLSATGGDPADAIPLLRRVIAVTAPSLDAGARLDLERLATSLEVAPLASRGAPP